MEIYCRQICLRAVRIATLICHHVPDAYTFLVPEAEAEQTVAIFMSLTLTYLTPVASESMRIILFVLSRKTSLIN